MTITLSVVRDPKDGEPISAVELVDSPDDNGWYASETDFETHKQRVSKRIYPNAVALKRAIADGRHKWENWR